VGNEEVLDRELFERKIKKRRSGNSRQAKKKGAKTPCRSEEKTAKEKKQGQINIHQKRCDETLLGTILGKVKEQHGTGLTLSQCITKGPPGGATGNLNWQNENGREKGNISAVLKEKGR